MPIIKTKVQPAGGHEEGVYVGDELASPVAGLPAGTRLTHLHAILLYSSGVEEVKIIERPGREKQMPIFSRNVYGTFVKMPPGAFLFERNTRADHIFYDLNYDRFIAVDAINTRKYSTTFQLKAAGAYLKIPIGELVVKVDEKTYKGIFTEVPFFATEIITQLCLELFEMNTNFLARQNAILNWQRPHGNLIKFIGFLYNNFVNNMNIKEAAIQQVVGEDNLKAFKDSIRGMKVDFLASLTADEMLDAVGAPEDIVNALGMEALKELFGDEAEEKFKSREFVPESGDADELFAQAEKAQKELEELMGEAGAQEQEADIVVDDGSEDEVKQKNKAAALLGDKQNVIVDYEAGEAVITQGGGSDETYVVLQGEASVFIEGVPDPVATLKRNDFFGYMLPFIRDLGAQYSRFERSATIKAKGKVKVLAMTKLGFTHMIKIRPIYAINLIKQVQRDVDRMLRDKNLTREEYEELQHRMAQIEKYEKAVRTIVKLLFIIREELKAQAEDPFLSKLFGVASMVEKDYFFEKYVPTIKEMRKATPR